jgi:RNA polymerase sigma-70 factor (ECF subfamily)
MDEESVVQRCQQGDLMAYRMVYDRYEQPFLRTAFRMLGRQQEAEDAVQDTFLKLYRGIHHYKSGSRFSTYIFRILINSCYDMLRKRNPEVSADLDQTGFNHQPSSELRHSIQEAVAALPDQMRACFVLSAVEGLKQEEIAQVLGINVGTVKATIHRAKAKLRAWLSASRKEEKHEL